VEKKFCVSKDDENSKYKNNKKMLKVMPKQNLKKQKVIRKAIRKSRNLRKMRNLKRRK